MEQIRYIIWDLDGTLTYTLQDLCDAVNHALRTFNMPARTLQEVRHFVGNGVRRLMELAVPNGTDNPQFEQCFCEFKAYYKIHCKDNTRLYDGVADTLKQLKADGYIMAIVSNKLQAGVTELYDEWFHDTIDIAIGERPELKRKPAPDMVQLAMQQMGATTSNAVYIGDSEVDIATALNSNLPCISVLWGFRDKNTLMQHGARIFADTPADIIDILKSTKLQKY